MSKTKSATACVWWWNRQAGRWQQADAGTRAAIRKGGRVAYDGSITIGPPDGPPSDGEIEHALTGEST